MSCDGQDTYEDYGTLAENTKNYDHSRTYNSGCPEPSQTITDNVSYVHATVSEDEDTVNFDEIPESGYKWYQLAGWYENPPDGLLDPDCYSGDGPDPYPTVVSLTVRHPDNLDDSDYYLDPTAVTPDGDEDDSGNIYDEFLRAGLGIVGVAAGATGNYLIAGAATTAAAFVDESINDPIQFSEGYYNNTNRQNMNWEMDMDKVNDDNSDNFPSSLCEHTGVRFQIEPSMPSSFDEDDAGVYTWSRQGYVYYAHDYKCVCTNAIQLTGTTDWVFNNARFDVVQQ